MDKVILYRLMDAVRDSLDRAGRHGYSLHRLDRSPAWFNPAWLQDYLEQGGYDPVPLMWEGRALPSHDELRLLEASPQDQIWRETRTGEIGLRDDVLVAAVTIIHDNGRPETVVVAGERVPGALQRFMDAYSVYARRRSREWPAE